MTTPEPARKNKGVKAVAARVWHKLRSMKPRRRVRVAVGLIAVGIAVTIQQIELSHQNVSYQGGQDFVLTSTSQGIGPTPPNTQTPKTNAHWTVGAYCLEAFDSAKHLRMAGDTSSKKRWLEGCANEAEKLAKGGT
jgi:hypothetical protein